MRILILTHAFNSLAQRIYAELVLCGHELSVELDISDEVTTSAVELFRPELVVAPFLKRAIPAAVWQRVPCFIVHPGIRGDRGPAALDWAILEGRDTWGVTVLQAEAEMDAGPVWAWREFPMRLAPKSSLYRFEVTEAAVAAVLEAVGRLAQGGFRPEMLDPDHPEIAQGWRDPVRPSDRRIDWEGDDTLTVLRKIHSADGHPGVRDEIGGRSVRLFAACAESQLHGAPGQMLAQRDGALCRATRDGAVWLGRARAEGERALKLPAVQVLGDLAKGIPELGVAIEDDIDARSFREIRYEERGAVGWLHFDFHNGAMSTAQCERLLEAWRHATARPTRVVVLAGGRDFWSNGLHLNLIEAADSPADESWRNINAMDDLAEAIVRETGKLTLAAVGANAGAGGVFLALAADLVLLRDGVVLNPHYKNMGNLYGSELWTYLLPRRVGTAGVQAVMDHRLPMLARTAVAIGLADELGPGEVAAFDAHVEARAEGLATQPGWQEQLAEKRRRRTADEAARPLRAYREAELEVMKRNFYGFDPSYHVARFRFVHRTPYAWTPRYLAAHRRLRPPAAAD